MPIIARGKASHGEAKRSIRKGWVIFKGRGGKQRILEIYAIPKVGPLRSEAIGNHRSRGAATREKGEQGKSQHM